MKQLDSKLDAEAHEMRKSTADEHAVLHRKKNDLKSLIDELNEMHSQLSSTQKAMDVKLETLHQQMDSKMTSIDKDLRKQDEDLHKELNERVDGVERHHATTSKENAKRLNALDLRISGLQGASGEQKRDINKLR